MLASDQKREIEEFLYREAHLLDEHRFDEWLALLTGRTVHDPIARISPGRRGAERSRHHRR